LNNRRHNRESHFASRIPYFRSLGVCQLELNLAPPDEIVLHSALTGHGQKNAAPRDDSRDGNGTQSAFEFRVQWRTRQRCLADDQLAFRLTLIAFGGFVILGWHFCRSFWKLNVALSAATDG
jgi:hypothetical protein